MVTLAMWVVMGGQPMMFTTELPAAQCRAVIAKMPGDIIKSCLTSERFAGFVGAGGCEWADADAVTGVSTWICKRTFMESFNILGRIK